MSDTPDAPEAPAETPVIDTNAEKPAKPAKPKIEREKQNGQTKPAEGTLTRRLWDKIDEISAEAKAPATRKAVMAAATAGGFNTAMAASLYSHWRKFHGLTGTAAPGRTAKAEKATETTDVPNPPEAPTDETGGDVPPAPPAPEA